jgi:heme/copper-type cytochrome/quinol oxidase subunit 2
MKALKKLAIAIIPVLLMAAWLALPQAALACATCYGAVDAPQTKGMNNAILTLIAVVGVVYVGIGKVLLDFRRRSKKLSEKVTVRQRLRLIHGEKR